MRRHRARAETALAAIPGLAGARVIRRLIAGPTNVTWLVEHLDQRWVLRLDTPAAAELGLDRENEGRACAAGVDAYLMGETRLPSPVKPTDPPLV